ncbi:MULTISPECIES: hypothetical protein [Streptomyces]|uniref:hypothetical protein n=1 Tax=Streptomyces TaxID=1883 RepID=UPI00211D38C7|nr:MULTISPECIES: hypothetical protein [unclassified Streptomyces]WTE31600.1 hypothetical protein OHB50_17560 [Streptomyces anulatus]
MGGIPAGLRPTVTSGVTGAAVAAVVVGLILERVPVYRPRGIAVVEYRPDEPWEVRIVTRPTPEWSRRAEEAEIAPLHMPCASGWYLAHPVTAEQGGNARGMG